MTTQEIIAEIKKIEKNNCTLAPDKFFNYIIGIVMWYDRMGKTPNCNDCGRKNKCEVMPEFGEQVRWNCHMWEAKK